MQNDGYVSGYRLRNSSYTMVSGKTQKKIAPGHQYGFTRQHVERILFFLFFLLALLLFLFRGSLIAYGWLIGAFSLTAVFFVLVYNLQYRTAGFSPAYFQKRLFWYSLAVRVLAVFVLVTIADLTWGKPVYVGAVDAAKYFRVAGDVADIFWRDGFFKIFEHLNIEYRGVDAYGVPLVIGAVFSITTKSAIIAKLFIALVGSLSVIFIYKTGELLFDKPTARLAGLMAAFFPLSLFYNAVILKESFVVFLTSLVIFLTTSMVVKKRIRLRYIVVLIAAISGLFLFRVAAAAVIIASLAAYFLLSRMGRNPFLSWMTAITVLFGTIVFISVSGQSEYMVDKIEGGLGHGERRLESVEQRTTWQTLKGGPVLIGLAHFAPFPSVIRLPYGTAFVYGHDVTYYHIAGLVAWNILAVFALLGLWRMIRDRPQITLMVWSYCVGYTFVLGFTAMFTQVRLGWNVLPMMMIPVAVGIMNYTRIRYLYISMLAAGLLIIAWNVFRAMGKGLM